MLLRGEARVFEDAGNREAENVTFASLGASVQLAHKHRLEDVECSGGLFKECTPADRCERSLFGVGTCGPKTVWDPDGWSTVKDGLLAKVVGALDVTTEDVTKLRGIKLTIYCGEKKHFGPAGGAPPTNEGTEPLVDCLQRGVKQNARLHATEPWKLYFEEEVVAVAVFDEIVGRRCNAEAGIPEHARAAVCAGGAVADQALGSHLGSSQKRPTVGRRSAVFRGIHSGAGYPEGAPREIVLRPEDLLEAVDMLLPEFEEDEERDAEWFES